MYLQQYSYIQYLQYERGRESTPVSSTNKTERHDITELLLKVALNTIALTNLTILI